MAVLKLFVLFLLMVFFSEAHASSSQEEKLDESNFQDSSEEAMFLEAESYLTAEDAAQFFPTERAFINDALDKTKPKEVGDGSWKLVGSVTNGPYTKLRNTLVRVSSEVFKSLNTNINPRHHLKQCAQLSHVSIKTSPQGIQYKYLCSLAVTALPTRSVHIHAWDRYGVVDLINYQDVTEKAGSGGFNDIKNAWYIDLTQIK